MGGVEEYIERLRRLGGRREMAPSDLESIKEIVTLLREVQPLTTEALADLVRTNPDVVPILGLAVGLSQEQLKNTLRMELKTSNWRKLAKERPIDLINVLDRSFDLVDRLDLDLEREFSYVDVLSERFQSRLRAGGAIQRGRDLEDAVQEIVDGLQLPREMRTRFVGTGGQDAPADLAIPSGGTEAKIVIAIKGFDSTGSKLTDAAREVQEMANIRRPDQFVFVVVDGMGWLSRQSDLNRILTLADDGSIAGVYAMGQLGQLREALLRAATILRLIE